MLKIKLVTSITVFVSLLIITSVIKNKTRIIEKSLSKLNLDIVSKEINLSEAQLDYYYLSSPKELEKRLNKIGFNNYQPISYSKIFLNITNFVNLEKKISNLKIINEEKIKNQK